jgi:hypothetical protein
LISDAWRADNWGYNWFKPTGWRPENFEEKYPVNKITNVYTFDKYGIEASSTCFVLLSTLITLLFVSFYSTT